MIIQSRVIVADKPNANGVVWPKDVLKSAIDNINTDILLQTSQSSEIDLTKVCGKLINKTIEEDDFIVDFDVLSTPSGVLLEQMIESDLDIGISMTTICEVIDGKITEPKIIGFNIVELDEKCPHITKVKVTNGLDNR